jgi:predicted CXXCH cytochrome family protein
MTRIVALALSAALALACAPRPRTAPDSPAAGKALFVPYAPAEIAGVKDPHDFKGKALCQRCHYLDGKLTAEPNALCAECHRFSHGNHPVEVVQKTPVKDLPLLAGGRVACHTCHDPHQKKSVLRRPFNELCRSCHRPH